MNKIYCWIAIAGKPAHVLAELQRLAAMQKGEPTA